MFDPKNLLKLRDRLESAALVAEAKAKQHKRMREELDATKEQARADSARFFGQVCKDAHRLLTSRIKRAAFVPPTLAEVQEFVREDESCKGWPAADVELWWYHFQSIGWRVGKGAVPMKEWDAAARKGAAYWRQRSGRPAGSGGSRVAGKKADPLGWREFLTANKSEYREYQYAPDFLKTDFNNSRK